MIQQYTLPVFTQVCNHEMRYLKLISFKENLERHQWQYTTLPSNDFNKKWHIKQKWYNLKARFGIDTKHVVIPVLNLSYGPTDGGHSKTYLKQQFAAHNVVSKQIALGWLHRVHLITESDRSHVPSREMGEGLELVRLICSSETLPQSQSIFYQLSKMLP